MPTVVATVGSASANSFVTVAETDTYCDARMNATAWADAEDDDKARAVIDATRELSAKAWVGTRASSTQKLSWPRSFAINPDVSWASWAYYDSTTIPDRVKDATCELAFLLLNGDASDINTPDSTLNVKVKTVDVLTTEYFDPQQRAKGLSRLPSVTRFIRPLLEGVGFTSPITRG